MMEHRIVNESISLQVLVPFINLLLYVWFSWNKNKKVKIMDSWQCVKNFVSIYLKVNVKNMYVRDIL
jgi:hypothetical protein